MTEKERYYLVDTNVLLDNPEILKRDNILIPPIVLRELENLERNKNNKILQYAIRKAKRMINEQDTAFYMTDENSDIDYNVDKAFDMNYGDNIILANANKLIKNNHNAGIITNDLLLSYKAKAYGIPVEKGSNHNTVEHTGVKDMYYNGDVEYDVSLYSKIQEIAYQDIPIYYNPFDMNINEYLAIWDINKPTYKEIKNSKGVIETLPTGGYEPLEVLKFDGVRLKPIQFKKLDTVALGKVEPLNIRQRMAFDLMQDPNSKVKLIKGVAGSGKDYIMLSHALDLLEKNRDFKKILWVRNNTELADTKDIGALPNSKEEKLLPFAMPIADILGDKEALERMVYEDKLEIEHLGFLRGRSFDNTIIYVTEAQNTTKEQMRTIISRAGKNSLVFINGDLKQSDTDKFKEDNGVMALQSLVGQESFGQVKLDLVERSDTARLSELF